jgi:putative selenate reductase
VSQAKTMNARSYLAKLVEDPRYKREANLKLPPKVGTKLSLFDCITCDKCVPVCPNDANFTYVLPRMEVRVVKVRRNGKGWEREQGKTLVFEKKHQLATFADFCNECGNCDVFCPEDGGPYLMKPRFFGSREQFARFQQHDGLFVAKDGGSVLGRFEGKEYSLAIEGARARYEGDGFRVVFAESDPEGTVEGEAAGEVDLTWFQVMNRLRKAVLASDTVNYVNA